MSQKINISEQSVHGTNSFICLVPPTQNLCFLRCYGQGLGMDKRRAFRTFIFNKGREMEKFKEVQLQKNT